MITEMNLTVNEWFNVASHMHITYEYKNDTVEPLTINTIEGNLYGYYDVSLFMTISNVEPPTCKILYEDDVVCRELINVCKARKFNAYESMYKNIIMDIHDSDINNVYLGNTFNVKKLISKLIDVSKVCAIENDGLSFDIYDGLLYGHRIHLLKINLNASDIPVSTSYELFYPKYYTNFDKLINTFIS